MTILCSGLCVFWRACEKMCAHARNHPCVCVCSCVKSASIERVFPASAAVSQPLSRPEWVSVGESTKMRHSLIPHRHISSWTAYCVFYMFQCVCVHVSVYPSMCGCMQSSVKQRYEHEWEHLHIEHCEVALRASRCDVVCVCLVPAPNWTDISAHRNTHTHLFEIGKNITLKFWHWWLTNVTYTVFLFILYRTAQFSTFHCNFLITDNNDTHFLRKSKYYISHIKLWEICHYRNCTLMIHCYYLYATVLCTHRLTHPHRSWLRLCQRIMQTVHLLQQRGCTVNWRHVPPCAQTMFWRTHTHQVMCIIHEHSLIVPWLSRRNVENCRHDTNHIL